MAASDAQFVFETNLPQVRKEITAELAAISAAVSQVQGGSAGGDLLSGVTGRIKKDVAGAIEQIRQVQEQARQQVESGRGLKSGQQTAALQINDVLAMLYGKVESRLREAALKAGPEAAGVDIKAMIRQLDEALFAHVRNQSRAMIREVERTGTSKAQGVFGTANQIPGRRAQTDLTTVGELQGQVAAAKEAAKSITASQRRLQKATDDSAQAIAEQVVDTKEATGQRRSRSRRLAKSEEDLAAANEETVRAAKDQTAQKRRTRSTAPSAAKNELASSTSAPVALTSNEQKLIEAERELTAVSIAAERALGSQRDILLVKATAAAELVARLRELVAVERELQAAAGQAGRGALALPAGGGGDATGSGSRGKKQADAADKQIAATQEATKATKEETAATKTRVTKINLSAGQQDENQRILRGLQGGDPNFGYATRTGEPGTGTRAVPIIDRSDPNSPRFFDEKNGGASFEEIPQQSLKYARLLRQENARLEAQQQAEAQAEAERLAAIHANTQRLLLGLATERPGTGYVTKNGQPGQFAFEGSDAQNAKIYKNVGTADDPDFREVDQSSKEYAHTVRRLIPIMERLGTVWAEQAETARLEAERSAALAAEEGLLQVAISARIRQSLMNRTGLGGPLGDNEYDFLTPKGTPSKEVFNPVSKKVYRENEEGGYNEILPTDPEWPRVQRRLEQVMATRATTLQQEGEQDQAADEAIRKAAKAYATSLDIKARLANPDDASVQYLSDSSLPTARIGVGPDGQAPTPGNARYFQRQGEQYTELHQRDENGQLNAKFIDAENLLTIQLRERAAAEERARKASDRLTHQLEASTNAAVGAAQAGGGGFGGGLRTGLFSGGLGDNGEAGAYGIGRALGNTVKYDMLYKSFNLLLTALSQVGQEFLNVDDSVVQLQYAMGDGADVTTDFINRLQDVSAPGGFNVGDAMDQASASIRAYRDQIRAATDDTGNLLSAAGQQKLGEDIGANFTQAATQIAVLGNTTLDDALQNTRATALGFGLNPLTGGAQVADAVANANFIGGGLPKDITQGGANIAEVASAAGFSLQEALSIISKISADTDESGQLAATRLSRMVGTLQGTSGKNFLTQLNQTLPQSQQIDISASPRDQLVKLLTQVYPNVGSQTQQQIATAVGGQAQQKEFDTLAHSLPSIVDQSATPQVGLAAKQYQDMLGQVRDTLGTIKGEVRDIITNLATSGALDAFGLGLKVAVPILDFIRRLTGWINEQLDKMPDTVKQLGGALVGVLATLKAISFIQTKGGGSFRQGFKNVLNNAEAVVRPEAQLARGQLSFQNMQQEAELNHALRINDINSREASGEIGAGAASKERTRSFTAYNSELRAGAADVKRSAKLGASALEEGGKALEGETKKSAGFMAGWRAGVKPDGIRTGLAAGAAEVKIAVAEFAAAIRGGAAQVGVASEEAAVETAVAKAGGPYNPAYAVGGRRRRVAPPAAGAAVAEGEAVAEGAGAAALTRGGKIGGFLGGAGRNVLAGASALLAPEVLIPMVALAAVDAALQVKSTADTVDKAQGGIDAVGRANIAPGAADLIKAADANAAAAQSMREATGGVSGFLFNGLANVAYASVGESRHPDHSAADATELGSEQKALAERLRQQQADSTLAIGPAALASQINTATGSDVKDSVDSLLGAGQSASSVLDALALTLKNLKFAANGTVGEMSALQKTDLAGRMGIAAGRTVPQGKDALQHQIDLENSTIHDSLDPDARKKATQHRNALQGQLDALNKNGEKGVADVTTSVMTDFFEKNPTANLNDPKVNQGVRQQIVDRLMKQGLGKGDAAVAATHATADMDAERQKFLTQLATPEVAAQLVDSTITVGQMESQRIQSGAQLKAMRTGGKDRSATEGLQAYKQRLLTAQSDIQADIDAMDASGADSSALRLQSTKILNELSDTEVKIMQQASVDAKNDIDEREKRRKIQQGAASSAAQVKAIGDAAIHSELKTAIGTMDPDLLASVIERASDEELDNFKKFLQQKLNTDQTLIEKEKELEIAAGLLNPDGTSTQLPSPLLPRSKNPQSSLPDFLRSKSQLPKPLQDLLNTQGSDQAAYDLYQKIVGETNNNGAASTGSDVPGGTPDERKAAAAAASAERNRNSTQAAAAKVAAAKAARDKITDHGTEEYKQAEQQYYAALNAQADLAQDTAISQAKAGLYPGDKVGAAKVAVDDATNNVKRFAKGSKEYWDAVGKLVQTQVDYAAAQREQANLIAQTHIDLTDPVAVANQALKDARRKLADDRKNPKADAGTLAADQIDVKNKENAAEDAAFRQRLDDAQTSEQLGHMSHAAYMRFLENESKRLHAIKHKTRQQINEMNEVDKDIQEANKQLTGQFNLGDIKIPTVYEVRRSIQAQAAGLSANAITTNAVANNTTNNVTVNGADFARVTAWLQQVFGKTARVTTTPRKA